MIITNGVNVPALRDCTREHKLISNSIINAIKVYYKNSKTIKGVNVAIIENRRIQITYTQNMTKNKKTKNNTLKQYRGIN